MREKSVKLLILALFVGIFSVVSINAQKTNNIKIPFPNPCLPGPWLATLDSKGKTTTVIFNEEALKSEYETYRRAELEKKNRKIMEFGDYRNSLNSEILEITKNVFPGGISSPNNLTVRIGVRTYKDAAGKRHWDFYAEVTP